MRRTEADGERRRAMSDCTKSRQLHYMLGLFKTVNVNYITGARLHTHAHTICGQMLAPQNTLDATY